MDGAVRVIRRTKWALLDGVGHAETEHETQPREPADEVTARFHELRDSVYRYVVYALRNPSDAEEITQETFLKLYRALKNGQHIACVSAWVFSIARNLSIDQTRQRERRHVQPLFEDGWRILEQSVPSGAPSCEDELVRTARYLEVQAALGALTDTQRQCFQLRVEGLRYREIAEILGMSVCGVADAVQRAVKKLRESVGD